MPYNTNSKYYKYYQHDNLSVIGYYLLVIFSLTGLSTVLGLTDTLECLEDLDSGEGLISGEINNDIYEHLQFTTRRYNFCGKVSLTHDSKLRVVRRFRYDFRLPGIKVQMFHILESYKTDKSEEDERLHLVEFYESSIVRVLGIWGVVVGGLCYSFGKYGFAKRK